MCAQDRRQLLVCGLDYKTSKETVIEHFSCFGEVVGCDFSDGETRGNVLLTFSQSAAIEVALSRGPHVVGNRNVEVRSVPLKATGTPKKNRVFVGGIRDEITHEDLQSVFSQFGNVNEVEIFNDKDTGKCRGFAFVSFEDPLVSQKVLSQRVFNIKEHKCEVKPAVSGYQNRDRDRRRLRLTRNRPSHSPQDHNVNGSSYQMKKPSVPFAFFQNTPPPIMVPAPPPLYAAGFHSYSTTLPQHVMVLPPYPLIESGPERSIPPVIYQEFPDGPMTFDYYVS